MAEVKQEVKSQAKSVSSVQTEEGKANLVVMPIDGSPLFRVAFEKGGVVPKELQSLYTSQLVATKAIQAYLNKRG
jgi:hypothetical protein